MKLGFSQRIFEVYLNAKFRYNSSSASRIIPCGRADGRTDGRSDRQTDIHGEAYSRLSHLCERAQKRICIP